MARTQLAATHAIYLLDLPPGGDATLEVRAAFTGGARPPTLLDYEAASRQAALPERLPRGHRNRPDRHLRADRARCRTHPTSGRQPSIGNTSRAFLLAASGLPTRRSEILAFRPDPVVGWKTHGTDGARDRSPHRPPEVGAKRNGSGGQIPKPSWSRRECSSPLRQAESHRSPPPSTPMRAMSRIATGWVERCPPRSASCRASLTSRL